MNHRPTCSIPPPIGRGRARAAGREAVLDAGGAEGETRCLGGRRTTSVGPPDGTGTLGIAGPRSWNWWKRFRPYKAPERYKYPTSSDVRTLWESTTKGSKPKCVPWMSAFEAGRAHQAMMAPARDVRPRRLGGGRSEEYSARRRVRGTVGEYAAEWSDSAAHSVFTGLHAGRARAGGAICRHTEGVLMSGAGGIERFLVHDCHGACAADRALAADILVFHADRLTRAATRHDRVRLTRAFLKPLRERARARGQVGVLDVALHHPRGLTGTFHKWLSANPEEERLRVLPDGGRTHAGLARWPTTPHGTWGVVCYERAAGRLLSEGGRGRSDAALVRTLVRTDYLPTAVASAADHYVLVGPEGQVRYMTVEEVARGFGLAANSPLMATLRAPEVLTAVQAVGCLGRSVHVGVARLLVRHLLGRGLIGADLTYGSAYAGLDCFAAALDAELGVRWRYLFASEREPHIRRALLHAWAPRGLTAARCHGDATAEAATREEVVDLWVVTSSCEPFSRRNRSRTRAAQCASLGSVWTCLGYARAAAPKVIVVENVAEREVSGPLTGLLQRLSGYRVETASLDPRTALGEPMARERQFWILWRDDAWPQGQARVGTSSAAVDDFAQ